MALSVVPPLKETSGLPGLPTITAGAPGLALGTAFPSPGDVFAELSVNPNEADESEESTMAEDRNFVVKSLTADNLSIYDFYALEHK